MVKQTEQRLLIAGGGTGGHVLAGVAVASAWLSSTQRTPDSVLFVGAKGGIEEKLVPQNGFPLELIQIGSLNRVSLSRKIQTAFQLPFSLITSILILLRFKPDFVLGVGGYASGPVLWMARFLSSIRLIHSKVALLEQNSVPGFTNRLLSRWTEQVFVAFPGTEVHFPRNRVICTGNPVRSNMKLLPPAPRDPFCLFVFGGSMGAVGMNSLVLSAIPYLKSLRRGLKIIHQTGSKDFDRVSEEYQKHGLLGPTRTASSNIDVRVEKFIQDMAGTYSEASLLICRAGSSTLSEIAAVGRAAILVPLPTAADNHQEKNARVFTSAGAARLVLQQSSSGKDLAQLIESLISNPNEIAEMEKRVTQFFRPNAAQDVVNNLVNT